jgi:hypothetical protein
MKKLTWTLLISSILTSCSNVGFNAEGDMIDLNERPSYLAVLFLVIMVFFITKLVYKNKKPE